MKKTLRILFSFIVCICVLGLFVGTFYVKGLPFLVSNNKVISYVEKKVNDSLGLSLYIDKPNLKTGLNSKISFSVDSVLLKNKEQKLFEVKDFETLVSLKDILKKRIIIEKFGAEKLFVEADKILQALPKSEQAESSKKNDWNIDLYDSILFLNESYFVYTPIKDTTIRLSANNLGVDNTQKLERFIHFDFNADVEKNGKTVKISFKDDDKIKIKNKHIYVENCPLTINHSKVFFDAWANKNDFELNVFAKRFFIPDVLKLLETNIVENNIKETLAPVNNLNGDFDFNLKITKDDVKGDIIFNKISAKLVALNNMPFLVNSGVVSLKGNDITLSEFKGYYNNQKYNEFTMEGIVKDYLKTANTHIDMVAVLTNEFFKDYLSQVSGVPLSLVGQTKSKILVDVNGEKIDVSMMGKLAKGADILVDGHSLSPTSYDRALTANLHINGENLNIETINYYIAKELTRSSKGIKPIITLNGNMNYISGKIFDMGFEIPKPLPSEFLNVLIGQKMFKRGTFWGKMYYDNNGKIPVINGDLSAKGVLIPPQRIYLKEGSIKTVNNLVNIVANGKYRRSSFDFKGDILNELVFPIVIKNTALTIDNIDIDRILSSMNAPVKTADYSNENIEADDSNSMAFDVKNIIVEKASVNIQKGKYKEINFANVLAEMSLDKNSIFKLDSNKFDIAEGISTAKVNCDLKNQKYYLRLGVKDVDMDIMSSAILNIKKEITGKAKGLIELNTDETLKLNGLMKFEINDGTIQKVGLVEYVLKFASLFRNPFTMISPSVFSDMVNVPEGNFDKITGDLKLKDNKIELIKIKSYSPQLSAYIVGCYNLENSDAILRIYTKFSNKNKGFAGFLRNISLNSLANRIPLKTRNDENYYSAEIAQLPEIDADEKDCQIFVTKVDGDLEHNNFISSLKKIK